MRRLILVFAVWFAISSVSGCAGLQRKFTRKKKAPPKRPRIYQVKKYEKRPTPELYKKHYAYWMSWHSELISDLGQSRKRDLRCVEEIIGNLTDMAGMLVEEKANELEGHIEKIAGIRDVIARGELSQFNRYSIISTLEREDRMIKKRFCFSKIKDHLKTTFEGES